MPKKKEPDKNDNSIFGQFINEELAEPIEAVEDDRELPDSTDFTDLPDVNLEVLPIPPSWGSPIITRQLLRKIDPVEKLRPKTIDEIIGQDHVKQTLTRFMDAALKRGKPLDHTLLYGPPGLGKTTFASVISTYMGHRLKLLSGPNVDKRLVLDMITEMIGETSDPGIPTQVVFIDEIHGVEKDAMTLLLPLMEDFEFEDLELPPFTIIGATTEPSKLLGPLRDRFELKYQLEFYSTSELSTIIRRSLSILLQVEHALVEAYCDPNNPNLAGTQSVVMLAQRARGVPRVANHLVKRVVDFLDTSDVGKLQPEQLGPLLPDDFPTLLRFRPNIVSETMEALDIDANGLEKKDRAMLVTMLHRYKNRPVGIRAISTALGENHETVEFIMEPHLVRSGFINREQRGRTLTTEGMLVAALEMEGRTQY